jgi:hypothetical protein
MLMPQPQQATPLQTFTKQKFENHLTIRNDKQQPFWSTTRMQKFNSILLSQDILSPHFCASSVFTPIMKKLGL